jgi:glutaredoxin
MYKWPIRIAIWGGVLLLMLYTTETHVWRYLKQRFFEDTPVVDASTSKKLVLYSADWCHSCQIAKRYMKEQRIPFEERDIEKNATYLREWGDYHVSGVPLLVYGQQTMQGFDSEALHRLLKTP